MANRKVNALIQAIQEKAKALESMDPRAAEKVLDTAERTLSGHLRKHKQKTRE